MNDARSYAKPAQVGEPMPGESVATVIESKDAALPVGAQVLVTAGWVSHAVADAKNLNPLPADGIPARAYLGVLGMPGFTAYSGMAAIGKPKSGETVVVGAASGPGPKGAGAAPAGSAWRTQSPSAGWASSKTRTSP